MSAATDPDRPPAITFALLGPESGLPPRGASFPQRGTRDGHASAMRPCVLISPRVYAYLGIHLRTVHRRCQTSGSSHREARPTPAAGPRGPYGTRIATATIMPDGRSPESSPHPEVPPILLAPQVASARGSSGCLGRACDRRTGRSTSCGRRPSLDSPSQRPCRRPGRGPQGLVPRHATRSTGRIPAGHPSPDHASGLPWHSEIFDPPHPQIRRPGSPTWDPTEPQAPSDLRNLPDWGQRSPGRPPPRVSG